MKKIFMIAVIGVSLTMISCDDSKKKKMFPLFGSDASKVETTTVTETGSTVTPQTTPQDNVAVENTQTANQGTTTGENTQATNQGGTSGETTQTTPQETGQPVATETPKDENKDTTSTSEFQYATVINVTFDLTIMDDAKQSIAKAAVKVSADGDAVSASISDDAGKAAFKSTISQTCSSVNIVIEHPDYVSKTIKVDNIQDLAVVSRIIYLEKKSSGTATESPAVTDTDKDGVSDDMDQFPEDPALIAAVTSEYTIAFEDLYPNKGDADFNDLVVKIGLTEYINPENKISKINVRSKVLASGAGYKNQLWISILGNEYLLIKDPKVDTNNKWNSKKNEKYVETPVHSFDIVYENPVARTDIAPMPYDPYILANSDKKNQVHLPFVTTKFVGKKLDTDKFPWAVLVPDEWMWPYEGTKIFSAYPDFQKWYESGGKENQDWYLKPDTANTFPVPDGSALTAYLIKNRQVTGIATIGGLIAAMITVVVVINIRRRKLQTKNMG